MSGELRVEPPGYAPTKHDHFVLVQKKRQLVFNDPRMFGGVLFHHGNEAAGVVDEDRAGDSLRRVHRRGRGRFSPAPRPRPDQGRAADAGTFSRHRQLDGRRNSLARGDSSRSDWPVRSPPAEVAHAAPRMPPGLPARARHHRRQGPLPAARISMRTSRKSWLFWHRWEDGGRCPSTKKPLGARKIGGRTTCWSPARQKATLTLMAAKLRLDELLVARGLCAQPAAQAKALIMSGRVRHGTERLDKPGKEYPGRLRAEHRPAAAFRQPRRGKTGRLPRAISRRSRRRARARRRRVDRRFHRLRAAGRRRVCHLRRCRHGPVARQAPARSARDQSGKNQRPPSRARRLCPAPATTSS